MIQLSQSQQQDIDTAFLEAREWERGQPDVPAKTLDVVRHGQCEMGKIILKLTLTCASAARIVTQLSWMWEEAWQKFTVGWISLCVKLKNSDEKNCASRKVPVLCQQYDTVCFPPLFMLCVAKKLSNLIVIKVVRVFSSNLEMTWKPAVLLALS